MGIKIPQIIAHRGASGYAPENTLDSFQTAIDMGIRWVEFDVKLTKDFIPVVFHDETLDRTTNGNGNLADMTWDDLQQLEAGSWFADSFAGTMIPSLEQVSDLLMTHNIGMNVEIKPCPGRAKETAEATLDMLSRIWDDHDKIIISSFDLVPLEIASDMTPEWARGLVIPGNWPEDWPHNMNDVIEHLKPQTLHIDGNNISVEAFESLSATGLPLLAYTINDTQTLRTLQAKGIQGFFTDVPDVIEENILTVH